MITAEDARRISSSGVRRSHLSEKDWTLLRSIQEDIYEAAMAGKVDLEIGNIPSTVLAALQDLGFRLFYTNEKKGISWRGYPTVSDLEAYDIAHSED